MAKRLPNSVLARSKMFSRTGRYIGYSSAMKNFVKSNPSAI
jgi:hypothetical protein